jgi:hypothetical protein
LIAYSNVTLMRRLFIGAAERLIDRRGRYLPSDAPDQPWFHVRQSDQEMIWYEWTRAQTALRVVTLPEEFYCPLVPVETDDDNRSAKAIWYTAWRKSSECRAGRCQDYRCRSLHGHDYHDHELARLIGVPQLGYTSTKWARAYPARREIARQAVLTVARPIHKHTRAQMSNIAVTHDTL